MTDQMDAQSSPEVDEVFEVYRCQGMQATPLAVVVNPVHAAALAVHAEIRNANDPSIRESADS